MDGIAEVRARIAEIQAAFAPGARPLGAGARPPSSGATFAAALDRATAALPAGLDPGGDPSHARFARDLLARLGMPATTENVRAVVAWARAEGTSAAFNPLATTQGMPGATDFNAVGVKSYASYRDGLDATVRTLRNGRYDEVLAALRDGTSAEAVARAVAASPWGTGEGVLRVLRSGA
ncbi:MAG: hypothetical protein M5U14_05495 [Acidimicrobiia bacterium]|nr:hypothetical protein [Acidimicrobiia bacterium]